MKRRIFLHRSAQARMFVLIGAISTISGALSEAPAQFLSPSDLRAQLERSGWSDTCGKYQAALRDAVIDFDAPAETWHDLVLVKAGCLSQAGRDAEANILLEQALAIEPGSAILWDMLGTSYLRVRRLEEAIPALQAAIDLGREGGSLHAKLALAYLQLGAPLQGPENARKKQRLLGLAEQHQTRAMALENLPDSPVRHAELGTIKMAQGDHVAAIALYRRALELLERDTSLEHRMRETLRAHYLMTLGQARFAAGDVDAGRRTMEEAVEMAPTTELKAVMHSIAEQTLRPASSPQVLHEQVPGLMSPPLIPLEE